VLITGATPPEDRQAICDKFQENPETGPFFGSIRACGEGLNLTAAVGVVFCEIDFVPSKMVQAADRCHRIGQKGNILVKYYIVPGTIDAQAMKIMMGKMEMIEAALDCAPLPAPSIRREIAEDALLMTQAEIAQIYAELKAAEFTGNSVDARIGHSLAQCPTLTAKQAVIGKKLLIKYKQTQLK
jgi:hypothetical protein